MGLVLGPKRRRIKSGKKLVFSVSEWQKGSRQFTCHPEPFARFLYARTRLFIACWATPWRIRTSPIAVFLVPCCVAAIIFPHTKWQPKNNQVSWHRRFKLCFVQKKISPNLLPIGKDRFVQQACRKLKLISTNTPQKAQWPIGYGVGLRIKRSSVWIRPWPLRWATRGNGEKWFLTKIASRTKARWEKCLSLGEALHSFVQRSERFWQLLHSLVRHISKESGDRTSAGPFFGQSSISQHAFVWTQSLFRTNFAGCYASCCTVM